MFKIMIWVVLVVFSSQLAAEKIYKWVDENGQIHYSSKKPDNQEAETVKVRKGPKVTPKTVTKPTDSKPSETPAVGAEDAAADAEAEAEAKAQLAAADKVNNQKQCDIARKNLAALNATVRVTKTNAQGETVRLSDTERVNALKTAQQGIDRYCN